MHTSILSSSASVEKGLSACCCMLGSPVAALLGAQQASDDPPFVESGVLALTGVTCVCQGRLRVFFGRVRRGHCHMCMYVEHAHGTSHLCQPDGLLSGHYQCPRDRQPALVVRDGDRVIRPLCVAPHRCSASAVVCSSPVLSGSLLACSAQLLDHVSIMAAACQMRCAHPRFHHSQASTQAPAGGANAC